jgi:uncharacterized membrane protein YraQ (UPF0718 family)
VLDTIGEGLANAGLMAWEVWWALVLGFAISAFVQARVPGEKIEAALAGSGFAPIARATGFGAASSSCSYAAIAIARSLFAKGASAASALAFQFASTNLVWELGVLLWIVIGWQFTLAEFVGGFVLIALMTGLLRLFVSPRLEEQGRRHAQQLEAGGEGHDHCHDHDHGHDHGSGAPQGPLGEVAVKFRTDVMMLWKEILIGFLLAGFIALLGDDAFNFLFITDAPPLLQALENAVAGVLIAVLSFVCSIGNVPLAAVLWSGGISFGGVMAFIFADLIVLPIVIAYRKYYGWAFALRITLLMLVTMILAALVVDGLFSLGGLIPETRPTREDIFGSIELDYKAALNFVAAIAFAVLWWASSPRGSAHAAREPAGSHA